MIKRVKKIMILGAGQIQVPIIQKCQQLGFESYAVDFDVNAPGFQFADHKLIISTHDKEAILEEAIKIKIDGILTTSDFPVNSVAFVCDALGLPGLSMKTAAICTNKFDLRQNLPPKYCPRYNIILTEDDLDKISYFPAIIKPVDSSASRGVKRVNDINQLKTQYAKTIAFSNSKKAIIEEFIEGKEYSVETLTIGKKTTVIAITQKRTIGKEKGNFVEYSHLIPADISDEVENKIKSTVIEALKDIKLSNSAAHTEVIVRKNDVFIVEVGARLGGDFIASDLVKLATGVDMLEGIINISLGNKIELKPKNEGFSGIQFITPNNYQSAFKFIEKNSSLIYRYEIEEFRNVETTNSLDRLGYIIFKSTTRKGLLKTFNRINNEN